MKNNIVPDEPVQAALDTIDAEDTYVGEVDHLGQFVIDGPVNIKAMLTAAMPFLNVPPSPRAQALEEAAYVADKGNEGWLKKRDVAANKKEARDYETMAIACSHVAAAIRALSSQPVADGCITKSMSGYVSERDAGTIIDGGKWAILVHCNQTETYTFPVTVSLPSSPVASE